MFWNSTWQILIQRVVSNKPAEGVVVVAVAVVVFLSTVLCNSVSRETQVHCSYVRTGAGSFLLQKFWSFGTSEAINATVSNEKSNGVTLC